MFRHPRLLTLITMILLAVVAVGAVLIERHSAPLLAQQVVTVTAPPLLYSPEPRYEEPQPPPIVREKPKAHTPRVPGAPAKVAVIIDDVGLSRAQTLPAIALSAPITLAFLPYGEHVSELANKAHAAGHTVMLHLPMQPKGHEDPGPQALTIGLDAQLVTARIDAALARIPHAVGVNNHMGSAATADAPLMQVVMTTLKNKNLFFVDSYTNSASVAFQAAKTAGIPAAQRDVFLDNEPTQQAVMQQLQRLEQAAQSQGQAIAIGHPYPNTMAALQNWLKGLDSRGIKLVSITELLEKAP